MQRVPEPELMDESEQARAYAEANFEAPHEQCADLVRAWWQAQGLPATARVLDLGCGPADVLVRVARRMTQATFVGVDGSAAMLAHARERIVREGLSARVSVHQAFLPHDALPPGPYDVVVSNSLLHHLHEPQVLWTTIRSHAPNARVFIMDLMRPQSPAAVAALVATHTQGEPEVLRRDFEASLYAAFTVDEVKAQLAAAGLALDVRAVSDRHLVASS